MRIAIVNDMPLAVEALRRVLAQRPDCQVAWAATNGAEAVEKCAADTPDLVLMDLVMPVLDGVEATRRIMQQSPCAILVVTVSVERHADEVFRAMGAGALDAVDTPVLDPRRGAGGAGPLLAKVDILNRLIINHGAPRGAIGVQRPSGAEHACLVGIGASAGGPAALATVLSALPADFPAAVVIIQHVDEQFAAALASWLGQQSRLPVRAAAEGERPESGTVLLAAKNDHLVLTAEHRLRYTAHPEQCFYRPSVDEFFDSVARHWRGRALGAILTGMGRDGARGLKAMRDAGFHTIAQDQATCAVYGMPKAAAQAGAAVDVLPLEQVGPALARFCRHCFKTRAPQHE